MTDELSSIKTGEGLWQPGWQPGSRGRQANSKSLRTGFAKLSMIGDWFEMMILENEYKCTLYSDLMRNLKTLNGEKAPGQINPLRFFTRWHSLSKKAKLQKANRQ